MSFISSWLKDIVVLFILISIAELIMPKGNMRKYINLVIGLLIIFTIISPFVKLIKLDFKLDEVVFNYSKSKDNEINKGNEFYTQQEKQIEKIYKEKISKELIKLVEKNSDYKVIYIDIGILDGEEDYGEIDYIDIIIEEKEKQTKKNTISIEKIPVIEINNSFDENSTIYQSFDDLKRLISSSYTIEEDRIIIKIFEKGKGELNE